MLVEQKNFCIYSPLASYVPTSSVNPKDLFRVHFIESCFWLKQMLLFHYISRLEEAVGQNLFS